MMQIAVMDAPRTKPTIPEVVARFAAYALTHPVWGSLHLVLDDGNVEDHNVDFCIKWAQDHSDTEGHELAQILRRMSRTQRLKLPDKVDDFLRHGPRIRPPSVGRFDANGKPVF